ncbi:hypothetical protein C5E51_27505 [Nocardia nova]|nr:hypothetical protein C5E51_27505 [Nocardia nova]
MPGMRPPAGPGGDRARTARSSGACDFAIGHHDGGHTVPARATGVDGSLRVRTSTACEPDHSGKKYHIIQSGRVSLQGVGPTSRSRYRTPNPPVESVFRWACDCPSALLLLPMVTGHGVPTDSGVRAVTRVRRAARVVE